MRVTDRASDRAARTGAMPTAGPDAEMSTEQRQNRFGSYTVTCGQSRASRTPMTFEGRAAAVIVAVAQELEGTTPMYEHMFRVLSVESIAIGDLRVECERNNYAGD